MKIKKRSKGSSTVEAALIFPLIFIIIVFIIYIGILQFQNISSIAASMDAANYIAYNWRFLDNGNSDPENADEMIDKSYYEERDIINVYADSIVDILNINNSKKDKAQEIAEHKIGVVPSYFSKSMPINVEKKGNIFLSSIEVQIDKRYFNPFSKITGLIGFNTSEEYKYNAKATSVITSPSEFMRNIDFIDYIIESNSQGKEQGNLDDKEK